MEELVGELSSYKVDIGGSVLAKTREHKMEVSKLKEFKGTRFTNDVNKFLWGWSNTFVQ